MALKHKIDKLDEVPEGLRTFYAESNGAFYLQVEGMVPKAQLDEFRTNNIALIHERDTLKTKFEGIDPVKYKEYEAVAKNTPEAIDAAVRARVAQLAEEHSATIAEKDKVIMATNSQLDTLLVDGSLRSEAAKLGVLPTAIDDIVLRGRAVFRREDGQVIAKNEKGEKMYDKDGTSPLMVGSWIKDLKKNAPHLFEGVRGAGGQGNNGGGGNGGVDLSKATPAQKIAAGLAQMGQG